MLKPVCQRWGLAPLEATIVSFLYNNPGRDTAADIVEYRMLSKGNVSTAVESLMRKGLLQRRQDQGDRRRIHLSLTPRAKPITQEVEAVREAFRRQLFRGFTQQEQELFAQFQQRLAENTKIATEGRNDP
jgi:MarR family transcriptional regulator for hemolysin